MIIPNIYIYIHIYIYGKIKNVPNHQSLYDEKKTTEIDDLGYPQFGKPSNVTDTSDIGLCLVSIIKVNKMIDPY